MNFTLNNSSENNPGQTSKAIGIMVFKYSLLFFLFTFCSIISNAQSKKDSIAGEYLIQIRKQIEEKDYNNANLTLKKLFAMKTTLPDEVAFRYAEVQLGLGNYSKAKEAFYKYIDLTDGKGEFVEEAKMLIELSEAKICKKCNNTGITIVTDTCAFCNGKGKQEIACEACHGRGLEFCPSCKGQGVVYKTSTFGGVYQTCTLCSGKGIVKCRRCDGSGKEIKFCEHCKGKGTMNRSVICGHE